MGQIPTSFNPDNIDPNTKISSPAITLLMTGKGTGTQWSKPRADGTRYRWVMAKGSAKKGS